MPAQRWGMEALDGRGRPAPMSGVFGVQAQRVRRRAAWGDCPSVRPFCSSPGIELEDAAIADIQVHDLWHTFACRLLRAGADIYTVSKLLRHASVVMSERYAHLSQSDLKAAADCLLAPKEGVGKL